MGSLNKILNELTLALSGFENSYREVFSIIEKTLSYHLEPWRVKTLLFDQKHRRFKTLDQSPVFTSDDFIELFEKVSGNEPSFIVNDAYYFPINVAGKTVACLMATNSDHDAELPEDDLQSIIIIASLVHQFASAGVSLNKESNPEQILRKNRSIVFGEIAGGVLHELNNIMGAILGRAQLGLLKYQQTDEPQDLHNNLSSIEDIAKSGAKITKRLRNFSKFSESLTFSDVNLSDTLESALGMLEPKLREQRESLGKTVEINNHIDKDIEINSDVTALEEIFFNLVSNSLDAIENSGEIDIYAEDTDHIVRVIVDDSGAGMSPEVSSRAGSMYFTTKGDGGSGVGLSVVQNLLSLQGGTLTFNSTKGKGTRAIFTLSKNMPQPQTIEPIKSDIKLTAFGAGRGVLLVEDNQNMRKVLEEIITGFGFEVDSASTGEKGLELFNTGDYEIVFTDIGLPDTSGSDVAWKIKTENKDVNIAGITGWDALDTDTSIFDIVISKPFNINQIQRFLMQNAPKTIMWEDLLRSAS